MSTLITLKSYHRNDLDSDDHSWRLTMCRVDILEILSILEDMHYFVRFGDLMLDTYDHGFTLVKDQVCVIEVLLSVGWENSNVRMFSCISWIFSILLLLSFLCLYHNYFRRWRFLFLLRQYLSILKMRISLMHFLLRVLDFRDLTLWLVLKDSWSTRDSILEFFQLLFQLHVHRSFVADSFSLQYLFRTAPWNYGTFLFDRSEIFHVYELLIQFRSWQSWCGRLVSSKCFHGFSCCFLIWFCRMPRRWNRHWDPCLLLYYIVAIRRLAFHWFH